MPHHVSLPFLAPISIGSEVTIVSMEEPKFFGGWQDAGVLVIDHKSGILYGPEWMPLEVTTEEVLAAQFPGGKYRMSQEKPMYRARVVGCTMRSKGWGEHNDFGTGLLLEPINSTTPYRG